MRWDTSEGCPTAAAPTISRSFSFAQDGSHDAGIAATVENGQDNEGFFLWCIGDEKISHGMKTKRSRSQIGAAVAHLREGDESANCVIDFLKNAVGCGGIVTGDKFPKFRLDLRARLDGEQIRSCTAAVLALLAQTGEGVFAVDGWNAAALDVIVAAIQHVAHFG